MKDSIAEQIGRFPRTLSRLRSKLLGLATIKDIKTERFNTLIEQSIQNGWKLKYQYQGFDAWIDYGCIKLKKSGKTLKFEWDNWTEGSIEGSRAVIEQIAKDFELSVTRE